MNNWQPIETAPKDGTWVFLCGGKTDDESAATIADLSRPVVAQWSTWLNGQTTYGRWQFCWFDGGYDGEYERPTHWQPLPEPPISSPEIPGN